MNFFPIEDLKKPALLIIDVILKRYKSIIQKLKKQLKRILNLITFKLIQSSLLIRYKGVFVAL
jgi:hypothetical protein